MTRARLASPTQLRLRNGKLALTDALPPPTPGVLSITDFAADMTPFQRVGTSKAIPVSGACDPSLPSVQVRAINAATGDPIMSYTTIPASGGVFSGLLTVPQGDWSKLQVTDGASTVTTANRFGVGIVGLLIGQSNMVEHPKGAFADPLGDKRSIEYNRSKVLKRIGNFNDSKPPNTRKTDPGYSTGLTIQTSSRGDGYVYTANLLAARFGCIVCLVERAASGSAIASWLGAGSNWAQAAAALNEIGGDAEFAFWLQGESDANTMSTATMVASLDTLMAQLHALTGRNASTFHFGVTALGPGSFTGSSEGEFGNMRAAHVEFATTRAGAFLAACSHDAKTVDSVHVDGEAHALTGARRVASLIARLDGTTAAGPRIASASRSGTTVTALIEHSGGTALADGVGGSGAALKGFQFFDAGAAGATIAYSTAIVGNSIVFTLASAPLGALTMSYAMMNNPHNTDPAVPTTAVVRASCVYDNATIQNCAFGRPLQPRAALTVTGG